MMETKGYNIIQRGKRLAFLLRHDKNYQFDEHGWRKISDLINRHGYTMDELKVIVETNNKQRFEFSEDMTRIRARQGHSVHVDVELEEVLPPDILYHGTGERFVNSIMEQGINKGNRLFVHLSETRLTAVNVGKRHGKLVVLVIDAKQMAKDGHKFYLSRNGVWLTEKVDMNYLKEVMNMEEDYFATERNGHELKDFYDPDANTLDIRSNGLYPSNVLSNLCSNGFRFEGMVCGSMEGFLQSLKQKDKEKQRQICSMKGGNARKHSVTSWQPDQIVWWKGQAYDRQGEDYQKLIRHAYQAMFEQSERFRAALMQTRGITLAHTSGETNPYKTILTPKEFCSILTELRDNYDKRDKGIEHKKRVFVDMDNVLVDFESGLAQVSEEVKKEYEGCLDEIPGLFGLMKPMPGAIEAMHELQKHYDLFILSTAPWKNPSAWSDKVTWVTKYLDDVFHKRMVITHRKDLCQGDYLIDDRGKNGTSEFKGEWIEFGSEKFPDWNSVLEYLNVEEQ